MRRPRVVGPVGDDVRRALLRGAEGLGSPPSYGSVGPTSATPTRVGTDWYRFCKRTGHGDLEAARAWTEARLDAVRGRPDLADPHTVAYFYWSIQALDKARDALTQAAATDPLDSSLLLNLALVADELGDKARRDENFELLWTKHQSQAPRINQVCRVLRKWLAEGGKSEPDLAFVNATIERTDPDHRGDLEFFVGRLLMKYGKSDLGRPYLQRVGDSPSANEWLRILAGDAIRRPGTARDPGPRRSPPITRGVRPGCDPATEVGRQ